MSKFSILKMLLFYFKTNWVSLLLFTIFYSWGFAFAFFVANLLFPVFQTIRPGSVVSSSPNHTYDDTVYGIASQVNTVLFSVSVIVFMSILVIYYIWKLLSRETKSGRIIFWLSNPISRTNVYLAKFIFILSATIIPVLPAYLLVLLMSFFTVDLDFHALILLLCSMILWTLFIMMLATIFVVIYSLLSKFGDWWLLLAFLFIGWIIFTYIFHFIALLSPDTSTIQTMDKIFHYLSVQNLYVSLLTTSTESPIIELGEYNLKEFLTPNPWMLSAAIIFNCLFVIIGAWTTTIIFGNRNFNI